MIIWIVMARENEAREACIRHHLQLKRLLESNNSEDVLGTSALEQRFGPGARRMRPQLPIEIEPNISKPEQIRFILRRQDEYSFNAPILTGVRDGRDSPIVPPNFCN
jgi:hypothetical protein